MESWTNKADSTAHCFSSPGDGDDDVKILTNCVLSKTVATTIRLLFFLQSVSTNAGKVKVCAGSFPLPSFKYC